MTISQTFSFTLMSALDRQAKRASVPWVLNQCFEFVATSTRYKFTSGHHMKFFLCICLSLLVVLCNLSRISHLREDAEKVARKAKNTSQKGIGLNKANLWSAVSWEPWQQSGYSAKWIWDGSVAHNHSTGTSRSWHTAVSTYICTEWHWLCVTSSVVTRKLVWQIA